MVDLRIESAPDALQLMKSGWPTRIISLVGSDLRFELPTFGPHHFIARFHDIESPVSGYDAPSPEVLKAALRHSEGLQEADRLLIHCHAGKSRSPAMALGVLVANGLTPREAIEKLKSIKEFIIPNRLMVRILDELLDLRGELVGVVSEHYSSLPPEASLPDRGGWNI